MKWYWRPLEKFHDICSWTMHFWSLPIRTKLFLLLVDRLYLNLLLLLTKPNYSIRQRVKKYWKSGHGSGYQSAVLAESGAKVFSIERHKPLHEETRKRLDQLNYFSIKTHYGDGFKGLPAFAPFDKILVTCGAPEIPQLLLGQLKVEGVDVGSPVGSLTEQVMTTVIKKPGGEIEIIHFDTFRFVPMLGDKVR